MLVTLPPASYLHTDQRARMEDQSSISIDRKQQLKRTHQACGHSKQFASVPFKQSPQSHGSFGLRCKIATFDAAGFHLSRHIVVR